MARLKKVTPLYDITWYVKWTATVILLIAVACRSIVEIPKVYDQAMSLVGTLGWLWVGLRWHDRALIVLNSIVTFMLGLSLIRYFI